jgi:hypothetical protein
MALLCTGSVEPVMFVEGDQHVDVVDSDVEPPRVRNVTAPFTFRE